MSFNFNAEFAVASDYFIYLILASFMFCMANIAGQYSTCFPFPVAMIVMNEFSSCNIQKTRSILALWKKTSLPF